MLGPPTIFELHFTAFLFYLPSGLRLDYGIQKVETGSMSDRSALGWSKHT